MNVYKTALLLLVGSLFFATTPTWAAQPSTHFYCIDMRGTPKMALDIAGMGNADGAPVGVRTWKSSPNQEWLVTAQKDGSYKIYAYCAKNSLEMLDYNGSTTDGQPVNTKEDLAVDGYTDVNQRWWFKEIGNGFYRIIPFNAGATGRATLAVTGKPGKDSTLQIATYSHMPSQEFNLTVVNTPSVLANPKKGLPTASNSVGGAHLVAAAGKMNCSWIYNWSMNPPVTVPKGIEFVPMVWGWSGDRDIVKEVRTLNPHAKYVLGFNEPDEPNSNGGSNMTVAQALTGFQYVSDLKAYGFTVGGPACAVDTDSWMQSFLSQALAPPYNYHIDFIGYHTYVGGTSGAGAADGVLGFCDAIYKKYHLPMWATEFAPTGLSSDQALIFVRLVCQGFASRPYVQRYSMFTSEPPSSTGMGASALVNTDGTLTAAGQLYARM